MVTHLTFPNFECDGAVRVLLSKKGVESKRKNDQIEGRLQCAEATVNNEDRIDGMTCQLESRSRVSGGQNMAHS